MDGMRLMRLVATGIILGVTCWLLLEFDAFQPSIKFKTEPPRPGEGSISARNSGAFLASVRKSSVTQSISESVKCMEGEVNWFRPVKPKYELDPNKLLIPTLLNGPNNQMMGFRQSILLSLLLNRTLVLPLFYAHEIDKFFRSAVPVEHRLDIAKLRQFISVIPLQKAVCYCHSKIDTIFAYKSFNIMRKGLPRLFKIYLETGLSGVKLIDGVGDEEIRAITEYFYNGKEYEENDIFRNQTWWPKSISDMNWIYNIINKDDQQTLPILPKVAGSSDVTEIRAIYASDERCALHWYPFRQYTFEKFKNTTIKANERVDLRHFTANDGWKLYSDIMLNTPPPEAINVWSKKFQDAYLSVAEGNYLAVHWRYDEDDFIEYICKKGRRRGFCKDVRQATNSSAIAAALLSKISNLYELFEARIDAVYIAAPPTMDDLIRDVVRLFADNEFVRRTLPKKLAVPIVNTSTQLKTFVLREYRNCALANPKQLPDTISQLEMDICAESYSFMWSRQSTWSINVKQTRFFNGKSFDHKTDSSILDYVTRMIRNDQNRKINTLDDKAY